MLLRLDDPDAAAPSDELTPPSVTPGSDLRAQQDEDLANATMQNLTSDFLEEFLNQTFSCNKRTQVIKM